MSFVCYTVDFINIKHMLPAISLRLLAPIYGVFCCIRTSELSISLFNESVTAQGPTKETWSTKRTLYFNWYKYF